MGENCRAGALERRRAAEDLIDELGGPFADHRADHDPFEPCFVRGSQTFGVGVICESNGGNTGKFGGGRGQLNPADVNERDVSVAGRYELVYIAKLRLELGAEEQIDVTNENCGHWPRA